MKTIQSNHLRVIGATLHYTIYSQDSALPLLLLIAGGEGGGDGYQMLAEALSDRYQVVTYDRRGAPGSPLDNPADNVTLQTHSEDAHYLLDALTDEPAYVFGSSGGALVGLDLVLRYSEQVRTLVSHEPPVEGVLPEFDRFQDEVAEALQQGGIPAAMAKFVVGTGVHYDDLEPGVVLPPRDPQESAARAQALMRYTFPAVHRYRLDVAALAANPVRVILAAGSVGPEIPVRLCTRALADRLRMEVVQFPSHHVGYLSHPRAFAVKLDTTLREA